MSMRTEFFQFVNYVSNFYCFPFYLTRNRALFENIARRPYLRVSQGFWGTREHWQNIKGNKGTLANFWEQGTKFRKITVRKHAERVWEHGNIGQFWKGTREQGPHLGDPRICFRYYITIQKVIKGYSSATSCFTQAVLALYKHIT